MQVDPSPGRTSLRICRRLEISLDIVIRGEDPGGRSGTMLLPLCTS